MIGSLLSDEALAIVALAAILTSSRLAGAVFLYLLAWEVKDLLLKYFGIYFIGEQVFFGVAIDYIFLLYILNTQLKCRITPVVTAISAIYGAVCLAGEGLEYYGLMVYYGPIMGITAILAALEGAYDGRNKLRVGIFDNSTVLGGTFNRSSQETRKESA